MSIWSSRFGEEGVNLAADNSFRLQITNASTSPFTINLFNLGGSASTQTAITTGQVSVSINNNLQIPYFVNGIVTDPVVGMDISIVYPDFTPASFNTFPTNTTIAQINAFYANNVINQAGQVGSLILTQKPNTVDEYDILFTIDNIGSIIFANYDPPVIPVAFNLQNEQLSYVTNNPSITIRTSKFNNINFIQNSEIGNAYKVIGMGVYSDKPSQVLQPLNYFYRDANGDVQGAVTPPTIDPYQPNSASLQMIYVNDFQIFTNTQFQYIIDALSSVYLTFNYVNFGVDDFKMFDKVFYQQVRDKFWMDKKLIAQSRVKSIHIE
jgi:hypothetical protein